MATPGPKPLPKNVHVLQGNRSKLPARALFDDKILPVTEIPEPPDHLSPEAVEEWNRLGVELAKLGLISQIDRAAFAVYCQAYGRWVHAERMIQAADGITGLITTTPNGFQQMSAWLVISKQAVEQMKIFLIEFGMTPSSRSRVTPSSPQGDLFNDDQSDSVKEGAPKHSYFDN